jgi:hypothetical protein
VYGVPAYPQRPLKVSSCRVFDPSEFVAKGYQCAGYLNRDQGFNNSFSAIQMTFVRNTKYASNLVDLNDILTERNEFHLYRPFYRHDISILFEDDTTVDMKEKELFKRINSLCGSLVKRVAEVTALRCVCPKSKLHNRIYRITWQGDEIALGKCQCNNLQEELRSS